MPMYDLKSRLLSGAGLTKYWKYIVWDSPYVKSEYFPDNHDLPWPYGTKDGWYSQDEALRYMWPWESRDYARHINEFVKERNAHLIGDGVLAPPPCEPQPLCRLRRPTQLSSGKISDELILLLPPLEIQSLSRRADAFLDAANVRVISPRRRGACSAVGE